MPGRGSATRARSSSPAVGLRGLEADTFGCGTPPREVVQLSGASRETRLEAFGEEYESYRARVPAVLPRRPPPNRRPMTNDPEVVARLVDITTLTVDAIVNAANTDLSPGGGVCGAIHRAAGPELAAACARLCPCPTGEARLTPGFRLPARFVIHAVGPVWSGGRANESALLAAAYRSSLAIAKREGFASIAFPAISTGIYGYPLGAGTEVAVATVRDELAGRGSIAQVVFACFARDVLDAYASHGISV